MNVKGGEKKTGRRNFKTQQNVDGHFGYVDEKDPDLSQDCLAPSFSKSSFFKRIFSVHDAKRKAHVFKFL